MLNVVQDLEPTIAVGLMLRSICTMIFSSKLCLSEAFAREHFIWMCRIDFFEFAGAPVRFKFRKST